MTTLIWTKNFQAWVDGDTIFLEGDVITGTQECETMKITREEWVEIVQRVQDALNGKSE